MSKTILIIEDEISIQNIIRAFLEDAGYMVFCASDECSCTVKKQATENNR